MWFVLLVVWELAVLRGAGLDGWLGGWGLCLLFLCRRYVGRAVDVRVVVVGGKRGCREGSGKQSSRCVYFL